MSGAYQGYGLIKYSVDLLLSRGITEIGVALGYQGDDIRSELKGYDVEFSLTLCDVKQHRIYMV